MVLHKIEDGELIEYAQTPVSKEFEIHDFIEAHPKILGKGIFIVGREVRTADNNFIDLLGLDGSGDTIVVEVKKDETPRKVIAQILEYAEWVSTSIGSDELNKIAKVKHLTDFPSLWKKCEDEFGEVPEFNEHQKLFIVAEKIDPITEKLSRYLRKNGIDIFCIELNFYEKNGHRFCNTQMVVGKEKAVISHAADRPDVNYDWNYYSERRGWSDEGLTKMKELINKIIELSRKENWNFELKFNQRYCAIQSKNKWNMMDFRERNGLIRIHLPALRNKEEHLDSKSDWEWSESNSFWIGNFSQSELPSANDMKEILRKSHSLRERNS